VQTVCSEAHHLCWDFHLRTHSHVFLLLDKFNGVFRSRRSAIYNEHNTGSKKSSSICDDPEILIRGNVRPSAERQTVWFGYEPAVLLVSYRTSWHMEWNITGYDSGDLGYPSTVHFSLFLRTLKYATHKMSAVIFSALSTEPLSSRKSQPLL
jgi:hypothetical protein